jgi:hypothetical protein
MFRASSCPSSGAYQLQQRPLVYRRNVVVAALLVVVGPAGNQMHQFPNFYDLTFLTSIIRSTVAAVTASGFTVGAW